MNELLKLLNGEIDVIEFNHGDDYNCKKEELFYISKEEASSDLEVGFYVNRIYSLEDENIEQVKVSDKYAFNLLATL